MKIAVLGYGTVGKSVVKLIRTRTTGIDLKYILELPEKITEDIMVSDVNIIMDDPEIELVVDVLPAVHPSYDFIKAALLKGKHVVSSNKAALCYGFQELMELAEQKGLSLKYEASCGGTIPNVTSSLQISETNEITGVSGIMNGTTNYILYKMDKENADFSEVLKTAQALGYSEADPTADISGYDVKNKIIILSSTAYHGFVRSDIPMAGIEKVTKAVISAFKEKGKTVKLLGLSRRDGNRYALGVAPVLMGEDTLEASVPDNFNLITLEADIAGTLKFYGQGAGGDPTADAVIRDIYSIIHEDSRACPAFDRQLVYDPSLLMGSGHFENEVIQHRTLEELCGIAKESGRFFAFEPEVSLT